MAGGALAGPRLFSALAFGLLLLRFVNAWTDDSIPEVKVLPQCQIFFEPLLHLPLLLESKVCCERFINTISMFDFTPQETCSRSCVAESCYGMGIRYGKFCGVGLSGCPGEKPCDDLDACCMAHDECVGREGQPANGTTSYWEGERRSTGGRRLGLGSTTETPLGMTNVKCHERFKRCMKKVAKSGKAGFSETCPYAAVIPTMTQGMDMAILLSQFGGLSDLER
ncbi:hypothetical protein KSP40_PGU005185 [Platanthera guangdongensis]|uniref:Phospholipase A(2) n=1 Tax=Platanthera guangdongensis TaxID=2320717 RepID=A0ABR2N2X1_9ASPA